MRIDSGAIYAPDLLAFPIVYNGDPVINGISGSPTVETLNDVALAGGGPGALSAQSMANAYANAPTSPTPQSSVDPCSRYEKNSWQWWMCKGADIGTGGIGGDIFNKGQDAASAAQSFGQDTVTRAGLFLLALLVLGIGLWAMLR